MKLFFSSHFVQNFSWQDDAMMGRQVLTGVSPLAFELCKELPNYFKVSDEDVVNLLDPGKTLKDEMEVRYITLARLSD